MVILEEKTILCSSSAAHRLVPPIWPKDGRRGLCVRLTVKRKEKEATPRLRKSSFLETEQIIIPLAFNL